MFVRKKIWKKSTSIQIVENKREWGKTKQKVIKYIWSKQNDDTKGIEDMFKASQYIKYELEKRWQTDLIPLEEIDIKIIEEEKKIENNIEYKVNIHNIEEEWRIIKWISDIYWAVYDQLWFDSIFWTKQKTKNYADILKQITLARTASPKSKRASVEMLDKDYWIQINLQAVYDMMKKIDDKKIDEIQNIAFNYTKTVLNEKINVLFMDWTTLYFESQDEDWFREKWYSKDWKFSETQVALTILVTESWLPIWYKLYNWKHYEANSLKDLIEEVEKKYEINRVVLVADSWFLNTKNTDYLDEKWNNYILWARIKNTTKELQEQITDKSKYTATKLDENWNMIKWYIELKYKEKRMIVTYSQKRAIKDQKDRESNIEKLLQKQWQDIDKLVSNFWYKKFLKQVWEAKVEIDGEKINKAQLWDWLHWVITNDTTLEAEEVNWYYRWLWQVEESFRINKHDLMIRPIFHWTEQKIKAHVAIAFMAFSLVRHLEYRLKLHWYNYSPRVIREELLRIQWSVIFENTNPKKRWFLPSNISNEWKTIYQVMWKKWLRCMQDIV